MKHASSIVESGEDFHSLRVELPFPDKGMTVPIDICDHKDEAYTTEHIHDFSQRSEVIFLLTHNCKIYSVEN